MEADGTATEAQALSLEIQPLLRGRGPEVQSVVLADLMSLWLAGWPPQAREPVLEAWLGLVRGLVPESEQELYGPGGHPYAERRQ